MSETPKFEVIDRRKYKAEEEEQQAEQSSEPAQEPAKPAATPAATASAGPRLVEPVPALERDDEAELEPEEDLFGVMPPPPPEESDKQKTAYDASAQRVEDLMRAQNPAMGAPEAVTFEHLVQQLYVSAMLQMGAGTPQGQPARVDIIGARQSIDLLGILAEKTRGNLTDSEDRALQNVLYEARMAFLEVSRMIAIQGVHAPPPPKTKK